jgi:hypothetical protein
MACATCPMRTLAQVLFLSFEVSFGSFTQLTLLFLSHVLGENDLFAQLCRWQWVKKNRSPNIQHGPDYTCHGRRFDCPFVYFRNYSNEARIGNLNCINDYAQQIRTMAFATQTTLPFTLILLAGVWSRGINLTARAHTAVEALLVSWLI